MTITLSPETEADIRELLRLWGWDAGDPLFAEAVARGVLKMGVRDLIAVAIKNKPMVPQSIPDARVFEEDPLIGGGRAQLTDAERAAKRVREGGAK